MRWSFRLATLFGTEVRVHVTFLLLLGWYAAIAWQAGGPEAAQWSALFLVLAFVSILLHEYGHVLMARHYGIRTPDILLSPIGGLARLERMPEEPRQELWVALAGPAVTAAIIAILAGARALAGESAPIWAFEPGHEHLLTALLRTNFILLVFNLLPAFPMDGGRVLRALLTRRLGPVRGTRIAARIGQAFAVGFGILGLMASPMLLIIAGFIYLAAEAEARDVEARTAGRGLTASAMMITNFRTLPVHATLADAVALLLAGEQREFPVVDTDQRLLGLLTRDHLIRGLSTAGTGSTVGSVMTPLTEGVRPDTPFATALAHLRANALPALPVLDPAGVVVGLITTDNIADLVLVRSTLVGR